MNVLVFEVRAPLAHFRRPDTTTAHASYPFITRTALRGMLGSILGMEQYVEQDVFTGIQLLRPVQTNVQQLSMLGKTFLASSGKEAELRRPTTVELVVQPHYRIFYTGPHVQELSRSIRERRSVYHTYLGSAFAPVVPEWVYEGVMQPLVPVDQEQLVTSCVVPSHAIERLHIQPDNQLARAGGMLYEYLGERRFRGAINLVYDVNGKPFRFSPQLHHDKQPVHFVQYEGGEVVCLW